MRLPKFLQTPDQRAEELLRQADCIDEIPDDIRGLAEEVSPGILRRLIESPWGRMLSPSIVSRFLIPGCEMPQIEGEQARIKRRLKEATAVLKDGAVTTIIAEEAKQPEGPPDSMSALIAAEKAVDKFHLKLLTTAKEHDEDKKAALLFVAEGKIERAETCGADVGKLREKFGRILERHGRASS